MKKIIIGATASVLTIGLVLSALYPSTSQCNRQAVDFFQQSSRDPNMTQSLSSLSQSPLRASTQIYLQASPEKVFEYISSARALPLWMPGLNSVTYDHSNSVLDGRLGEGSQRTMKFGNQQETERIVQFERPKVIAYQIIDGVPLNHHIATMMVERNNEGSILTWNQYFDLKRTSIYGWLMPFIVRRFLDDAQANLTDTLGGEVVATCGSKLF